MNTFLIYTAIAGVVLAIIGYGLVKITKLKSDARGLRDENTSIKKESEAQEKAHEIEKKSMELAMNAGELSDEQLKQIEYDAEHLNPDDAYNKWVRPPRS